MAERTGGRRLELVRVYNKDRPSCITRCRAYHLFIEWKCLRLKSPWNTAWPPLPLSLPTCSPQSSIGYCLSSTGCSANCENRTGSWKEGGKSFRAFLRTSFVYKSQRWIYIEQCEYQSSSPKRVFCEDNIFYYDLIIRSFYSFITFRFHMKWKEYSIHEKTYFRI